MLTVIRTLETDFACMGILFKDEHPFCWTLEDPAKMLPEGQYEVIRKGNQIEIISPNGSVFFTIGHIKSEAEGNIILGFKIFSPRCVADSKKAVMEFQKIVKNLKTDTLTIRRLT